MIEWTTKPLSQVLIGSTRNGVHKGPAFQGSGTPIVKMGEVYSSRTIGNTKRDCIELSPREVEALALQDDDLLFCRTSLVREGVGRSAIVRGLSVDTGFASNLIRIRPNPSQVVPTWLAYYFQSPRAQQQMQSIARGTSVTTITGPDLAGISLLLPPLAEQRRIAGVLGALDDLIEMNRGLITDLNEMAAAQASRWIQSSDLKVRLSEVADHLAGKYLAKDKYAAGGPYVVHGSNSIMGTHAEFLHRGPLTVLARIGSFCGALTFSEDSAWINNNASAIRAKRSSDAYWLHRSLLSVDMDMHRAGSGQPFVRVESLMNTEIPWLSPEDLESANRALGTLEKAIAALDAENSQLASTRDELLPLLMSGRVRVREDGVAA